MDEFFKALCNVHRRRLLVALLDHNPQRDAPVEPQDAHEGLSEDVFKKLVERTKTILRLVRVGADSGPPKTDSESATLSASLV